LVVATVRQVVPVYPAGHVQYAALLTTEQVPPFEHGDGEQRVAVAY